MESCYKTFLSTLSFYEKDVYCIVVGISVLFVRAHEHRNRVEGQRGSCPSRGTMPRNFDEKMSLRRNIFSYFLFGIDILKIKRPKSEEKLEFGGK